LGAAVAGAGLTGYEFDRWQDSVVPASVSTRTVTEIQTLNETITETVRLASVYGRLFFDYNGNGAQDGEEPAVAGALVQLNDDVGKVIAETLTDSSGDYQLEDIKSGSYRLHIGVEHFSDKRFRYMCTSIDEFRAVADGYDLSLAVDSTVNIGLMEGFLTLPLKRGTSLRYNAYFDDDSTSRMKDWKGGSNTVNGHEGTDFGVPVGTPVFSAAPGTVKYVDDWGSVGIFVILSHDPNARNMSTLYAHLSRSNVREGQKVKRGERLGESGEDKTHPGPHLHFELDFGFHGSPSRGSPYQPVDPFRAVWNPTAIGYWTKDNDPKYPSA
jgi:murein DD-endopeptidase MepM/ murein hydrolase activator NlpD